MGPCALRAAAAEAWLYCNVRGCSRRTDRQEALGEMDGWMGGRERWGGQIGPGDKGTMAAREASNAAGEVATPGLPGGRRPPPHTSGCREETKQGGQRMLRNPCFTLWLKTQKTLTAEVAEKSTYFLLNGSDLLASVTATNQLAVWKSWLQFNFWAILPVGIQSHVNIAVSPTYHCGTAVTAASSLCPSNQISAYRRFHTGRMREWFQVQLSEDDCWNQIFFLMQQREPRWASVCQ